MADRLPGRGIDASMAAWVARRGGNLGGTAPQRFVPIGVDAQAQGRLLAKRPPVVTSTQPSVVEERNSSFPPASPPKGDAVLPVLLADAGGSSAPGDGTQGGESRSASSQGQEDKVPRPAGADGGGFGNKGGTPVGGAEFSGGGEYHIPRLRIPDNLHRVDGLRGIMKGGYFEGTQTQDDGSSLDTNVQVLDRMARRDDTAAVVTVGVKDREGKKVVGVKRRLTFPASSRYAHVAEAARYIIEEGDTSQPARWALAGTLDAVSPGQLRQALAGTDMYLFAGDETSAIPLLPVPENLVVTARRGTRYQPTYYSGSAQYADGRMQAELMVVRRDSSPGHGQAAAVDVDIRLVDASGNTQVRDETRYTLPFDSQDAAIAELAAQAKNGESNPVAQWALQRSLIALSTPADEAQRMIFVPRATARALTRGVASEGVDMGTGEFVVISEADFEKLRRKGNR